jgi:hypothetical protein
MAHAATVTGGMADPAPKAVWNPDKQSVSYVEDLWPWVLLAVIALLLLDIYFKRLRLFGYRTMRFDS